MAVEKETDGNRRRNGLKRKQFEEMMVGGSEQVLVTAPIDLPEGFNLSVNVDGKVGVTRLPSPVQKGQIVEANVHHVDNDTPGSFADHGKGQWVDGLFSCMSRGVFHPSLWTAWLCPQVLVGQLLIKLDMLKLWVGEERKSSYASLARKLLAFVMVWSMVDAYMASYSTSSLPGFGIYPDTEGGAQAAHLRSQGVMPRIPVSTYICQSLYLALTIPMSIYSFWVVVQLRKTIRQRHGIASRAGRWEDVCCLLWCNCCTLAQMARQTNLYEDYSSNSTSMCPHDEDGDGEASSTDASAVPARSPRKRTCITV